MFEIEMFPARNGDGLWLRYGKSSAPRHVLIDCGFAQTTTPLVVERLASSPDLRFELFVLTHIDADHIDGGIQLLLDETFDKERVGDVWFNGWQHIVDTPEDDDAMGGLQGEYFAAVLKKKKLPWNRSFEGKRIMVPAEGDLPVVELEGGLRLTVLSPDAQCLRNLRKKWKADLKGKDLPPGDWRAALALLQDDRRYASDALGGAPRVAALAGRDFEEDAAAPNGSSIGLLAEWRGKRILLLGDAFPSVIEASLRRLGHTPTRPLHVDVLKLSHHGSAGNTSPGLLSLLTYDHVLVSSNGDTHGHPHDEALARCVHEREGVTLHFNYDTKETRPWIKLARSKKTFAAEVGIDGAHTLAIEP